MEQTFMTIHSKSHHVHQWVMLPLQGTVGWWILRKERGRDKDTHTHIYTHNTLASIHAGCCEDRKEEDHRKAEPSLIQTPSEEVDRNRLTRVFFSIRLDTRRQHPLRLRVYQRHPRISTRTGTGQVML